MRYVFADCELDTELFTLRRQGQLMRIRPKVFQALHYLLEHRHRVVSKDEICRVVWPDDQFVGDATLERTISEVRQAVGDNGRKRRIIQTYHSHGYRMIAAVEELQEQTALPAASLPAPLPPPRPLPPPSLPSLSVFCPTCHSASPESATFCMFCGVRLKQQCPGCGQLGSFLDTYCPACKTPASDVHPAIEPVPGKIFPGETKMVTSLCCALVSPAISVADLEILHQQMQLLYQQMHRIVKQYEGCIHTIMPGQMLAVFGAPLAHEEHTWQAILAAFELQQCLRDLGKKLVSGSTTIAFRIGLHTGPAVVGGLQGDTANIPLAITGETVSIATALQQQAAAGTIVCSEETVRLLQGVVRMHDLGDILLPGYSKPVRSYRLVRRVLWRTPRAWRVVRAEYPFVGRRQELHTLQATWEQVQTGRGHVIGVVGEPGIGKSRLLYIFRQFMRSQKVLYLTGSCSVHGQTTPYLPILALVRHYCGITSTDNAALMTRKVHRSLRDLPFPPGDWAPYLLHLLGIAGDGTETLPAALLKTRIQETLLSLCMYGSQHLPLILEIEDMHWSDASSEECLGALVERIIGVPILLLITYRPGYRPPWMERSYTTQLALSRLSIDESLQMVHEALQPSGLSAVEMQEILQKAEGNPLFLEELTRQVREHPAVGVLSHLPDTVQNMIASRIDRLPGAAKQLLQTAAVIGKEIPLAWLRALLAFSETDMLQNLALLQRSELLHEVAFFPESVYAFHHGLTQEVAYHSLLNKTRQELHQKIAQMLVQHFPETILQQPELVAHHYTAAGESALAIPYWQQAGQQAIRRAARIEAVQHLQRGLALLRVQPDSPWRRDQDLNFQMLLQAVGRRRSRVLPINREPC